MKFGRKGDRVIKEIKGIREISDFIPNFPKLLKFLTLPSPHRPTARHYKKSSMACTSSTYHATYVRGAQKTIVAPRFAEF